MDAEDDIKTARPSRHVNDSCLGDPKGEPSAADQGRLFSIEEMTAGREENPEPKVRLGWNPVWTDNKARLIMLYLQYFVYIAKHGTYIDGFAGPQAESKTDAWAAKLVLQSEPRWLRHFHLCDVKADQVQRLEELKGAQPTINKKGRSIDRTIEIYRGDFNTIVDRVLTQGGISETEATFCLLDQRTFECDWATVQKLAGYKKSGNKIELFYFLANQWFDRALAGQKDKDRLARWWGCQDWAEVGQMSRDTRCKSLVTRLKTELRYRSVKAYPIFGRERGGPVMYYMIHATDHPQAPLQMARAYRNTVRPTAPEDDAQLDLPLAVPKEVESQRSTTADGSVSARRS